MIDHACSFSCSFGKKNNYFGDTTRQWSKGKPKLINPRKNNIIHEAQEWDDSKGDYIIHRRTNISNLALELAGWSSRQVSEKSQSQVVKWNLKVKSPGSLQARSAVVRTNSIFYSVLVVMWRQYGVAFLSTFILLLFLHIYQNLSTDFTILFLLILLRGVYAVIVPYLPLSYY